MIPPHLFKSLSSNCTSILELHLVNCKLLTNDCADLSKNTHLRHLRNLNLSCNPIKLQGLLNLLSLKDSNLGNLEKLHLYFCGISRAQAVLVPSAEFDKPRIKLKKLTDLNLSYNAIGLLAKLLFH